MNVKSNSFKLPPINPIQKAVVKVNERRALVSSENSLT
jgi:hypothetical protein